jgi:alpha/beta superfamily hydrolase
MTPGRNFSYYMSRWCFDFRSSNRCVPLWLPLTNAMKKLIFALMLFLTAGTQAQQLTADATLARFVRFYKANQADSIYAIFSSQMQAAVGQQGTQQMVANMKGQLGAIVKSHYEGSPTDGAYAYTLSFQRPLVNLALAIQGSRVIGIHQEAIEIDKNDPVEKESPDNISISNSFGTVQGTLLMPETTGKVPVVLLIAGSGPTDRNMNQGMALRTNSFLMLAKALAANGIASVRYDKRSVGKSNSTQEQKDLKLDDYVNDADSFVHILKADPRFSKVIVAGHSEGASIGLMAALNTRPSGYISLSGPSGNIATALKSQLKTRINSADYKIAVEVLDSLKAGKRYHKPLPESLASIFCLMYNLILLLL